MSPESARQLGQKQYSSHAVDLSDAEQVAAHRADFEAVLHSASTRGAGAEAYRRVYFNGVRNLVEQFPASKHLFVSSTSVYAQTGGEWVNEESSAEPQTETGRVLREAEALALSKGGTVIRLGGIYGPGRSALLKKFLAGEAILDLQNDRFINEIHRDDAATAVRLLALRNKDSEQIYNVVDNEPTSQSHCYRWLAAKLKRPLPPSGKSILVGKRGQSNKRVSTAKLRPLGWSPRFPTFGAGMEQSVLPSFSPDLA